MASPLTWTVQAKTTFTYYFLKLSLSVLHKLRLVKSDEAMKILDIAARKGWLLKYKIGDDKKWENIRFSID